jgi:hypothetical protein
MNCEYDGLFLRFVEAHMKDFIKDNKVKGILIILYSRNIIPNTIKNCTKYKNRDFKAHDGHLMPYSKIIL